MSVEEEGPGPADARGSGGDFRLAGAVVHPSLNRIETRDGVLTVEPKILQVLLCLAKSPGETVTKERLFEEVWDGAYVSEDVLTRAVGELRRVFEDSAAMPRVIETIRKRGYRLLVAPEPLAFSGRIEASGSISRAPARRRIRTATAIAGALAIGAVAVAILHRLERSGARTGPSRVRPLTTFPGDARDPAVSPDGTRVAYVWNGGAGDEYSLYVKLVDSEEPLRLTHASGVEDRSPAWSSDGQRLAFTRSNSGSCSIVLVSALGGSERPIAPCGDREYRHLAWSPDSRWLALARRDTSSQLGIELLSPETLERRALTHPPPGLLGDSSASFSPDGRTVAFLRNVTDGVSDVFTVPVSGGVPSRLTFDERDTMGLDWSSDGRNIVFSSSRAGIYSLWRVAARGGEPVWVAGGGAKMKHPSSARSRDTIAFESWTYEVNLWRVPAGRDAPRGGTGARLTETSDEWNFEPNVSPDGSRVAFVSTRSGGQEIWTAAVDGSRARRLTDLRSARLEGPRWSPDGARIVFSARDRDRQYLATVAADGGAIERLTSGAGDAVAPSWSSDGRAIYFGSRRDGSWQVWKLRLSDRAVERVTRDGGYAGRETKEGRWLYFTRAGQSGIWRQSAAGGPAERVVDSLAPEDWANWDVGTRGLYYREVCPRHRDPAVAFLAFGATSPVELAFVPDQGWSGFSVAADESWIVYPRTDRRSCEIRLLENVS